MFSVSKTEVQKQKGKLIAGMPRSVLPNIIYSNCACVGHIHMNVVILQGQIHVLKTYFTLIYLIWTLLVHVFLIIMQLLHHLA